VGCAAGLGWIGKHTNLITPEHGSWVFIGELLLNLVLEYDSETVEITAARVRFASTPAQLTPLTSLTSWTRARAFRTPRSNRARLKFAKMSRRILRGGFTAAISVRTFVPGIASSSRRTKPFEPRPGNVAADLSEILELTPAGYAERFRHSSMKRAKLAGLQRNARTLLAQHEPEFRQERNV